MELLLESGLFFLFETTPSDMYKLFSCFKGNTTDVLPPCHRRSSRPGHRTFGQVVTLLLLSVQAGKACIQAVTPDQDSFSQ